MIEKGKDIICIDLAFYKKFHQKYLDYNQYFKKKK